VRLYRPLRKVALPLLALVPVMLGADLTCATRPLPDSIVQSASTPLTGVVLDENLNPVEAQIDVFVSNEPLGPVQTVGGTWSYAAVPLRPGLNTIFGITQRETPDGPVVGTLSPFLLERRNDIVDAGRQDVFLDFTDPNFDGLMRAIAVATLEPDPGPAQLDAFAQRVKDEIARYVDLAYVGNAVVRVPASGPDVHRIHFDATTIMPSLLGESPLDFNSEVKAEVSTIFVTSFKTALVEENRLLIATPALESDGLEQRVVDIATLIGRTAAHELGHSLGLVVATERGLKGCGGSHNCPDYDVRQPFANRFGDGVFIMDPGDRSPLFARAGFADRFVRSQRLPVFNNYNKSYLGLVHP
jgi:hypothetical protein